jgi:hypothetical protein
MQPLGGTCEVSLLRHRHKVLELSEIDAVSLSRYQIDLHD